MNDYASIDAEPENWDEMGAAPEGEALPESEKEEKKPEEKPILLPEKKKR